MVCLVGFVNLGYNTIRRMCVTYITFYVLYNVVKVV